MWFKIKQAFARAVSALHMIPFNLRLEILNLIYGRGKIPADKLPKILVGVAYDEEAFYQVVDACSYLKAILMHYRIEMVGSAAAGMLRRYIHVRSTNAAERTKIYNIITSEHPALGMYKLVLELGDVSSQKQAYFSPPETFESMEAWVLSLKYH